MDHQKFNQRINTFFFAQVEGTWLTYYRRIFGVIILLELLFMTDTIIHVVYERWEPCFVPLFRGMEIPLTHFTIDLAIYVGMLCSVLFACDSVLPFALNRVVDVVLFLSYSYLRIVHFYWWNNHYYLNMILLFFFIFIHGGETKVRPHWEYLIIQLFFGTVYFFAGLSKISTAWLDGVIADTMALNHGFYLPNLMISYGGFLLDLFGGLFMILDVILPHTLSKNMRYFVQLNFEFFHLHNLLFMFKSIQFFPVHMLWTPLVFVPSYKGTLNATPTDHRPSRWKLYILLAITVSQALFATRRFFILVDHPWEIMKANDIAEFHSEVHHFSWRMKSRTCSSHVKVEGRWPVMMSIGMGKPGTDPEDLTYLHYMRVFFNRIYANAEFAIQPLVNRVRKTLPHVDAHDLSVNLFWWVEVNHGPFQLLINPELNFVGADHLPLLGAPPTSHVEEQIFPSENWKERVAIEMHAADPLGLELTPFVIRRIVDIWIPNPLIANLDQKMMPKIIVCVEGDIVVRVNRTETPCSQTSLVLPADGQFFLQFHSQSLFLLGFSQKS
jgi:hypothetical protein